MANKQARPQRISMEQQNVVAAKDRLQAVFPQSTRDVEILVTHSDDLETDLAKAQSDLVIAEDRHRLEIEALKKQYEAIIAEKNGKLQHYERIFGSVKRTINE